MVTITNGARTMQVTRGAFNTMFAPLGWEIFDSAKEIPAVEEVIEEEEKDTEKDVFVPLSEMTVSELKAFAAEQGIDVSAAKNKRDLKDIIKAEMGE